MNTGFYSLYRRSNYLNALGRDEADTITEPFGARFVDSGEYMTIFDKDGNSWCITPPEPKNPREQKERFSMTALAFCFEFDPKFREHFLHTICDLSPESAIDKKWKIQLEPSNWGDLVIDCSESNQVFIIEGKIGAPLQEHQNPTKDAFIKLKAKGDESKNGYGAAIVGHFANRLNADLHYIILGDVAHELDGCRSGVLCEERLQWSQKNWQTLSEGLPDTPLVNSLADCFERFNIPSFAGITTATMPPINNPQTVAKAIKTLRDVCEKLFNGKRNFWPIEADYSTDNDFWFGLVLVTKDRKIQEKLRSILGEGDGEKLAFFGFQASSANTFQRAVWFYCETAELADAMESRLISANQKTDSKFEIKTTLDWENRVKRFVIVTNLFSADSEESDQAWFCRAFAAAGFGSV